MDPVKEIVTVAEMARICGLSRSRFYGLVKEGIMPQPSRNPETKRPYYSREQQEQCLLVRKTNCGVNGTPILFYAHRLEMIQKPPTKKQPTKPSPKGQPAPQILLCSDEAGTGALVAAWADSRRSFRATMVEKMSLGAVAAASTWQ